jgi:glycosyltransferase involved in cell wall biosynthesis
MLAQLGARVRVIRNADNKGFVEACNSGAAAARGDFLVFLNNDTIVQPDWLSSLVETVKADETVGAVGSMLIFPDGRMQESGGIVWRDATGHLYGYGEHPEDLRFNFRREVDYCSGASLLVPKDLFNSMGGFDMRYAPAYYEDTDLCMSVRAANRKVIFQPLSKAIHFEGATAGRDTNAGFKRFQEINRQKFFDKWQTVLEREHLPQNKNNIELASNRARGQKIAVVFNEVPKPDADSGNVRMFAILEFLSKHYRVVFVPLHKRANDAEYEKRLGNLGVETVWIVDFDKRYANEKFDYVMLCYPHIAYYVYPTFKRMFPRARFIFDTVDVHFVRLEREYELTGDKLFAKEAGQFKQIETRLAEDCDQVWCVTENDKTHLQAVAPGAKIEIVPNIHTLGRRGKSFAERRDLLFIGNFRHRPNVDAIYYFLDKIFPLVSREIPDARFRIVGSYAPPEIFQLNSETILVEGFVPNIEPLFESCRVFAAPLRYGAGMKGKIGQALSFGLPTVTTGIGAEGMNLTDGREILIADEPEQFAEAVTRLYQSAELWQTLSDNGFRFIKENFSPPVIDKKIEIALEKISGAEIEKRYR